MTSFAERMEALRAEPPRPPPAPPVIGTGWSLWEKADPLGDSDGRRGGIVVDVERVADPDTGELTERYLLARVWRGRVRWLTLGADECSPDASEPNEYFIRGLCRTAAGVIAKRPDGSPDDAEDLQLFSLGCRLLAAIAPQRRSG